MTVTHWCVSCQLPDPYHGQGDGIGSCECDRCEWCAAPPLLCDCDDRHDVDWPDDDECCSAATR
jgi:hypothetical protein